MRKRILMVLMAAVLCFSTCACGSNAGGLGKLEINQKDDDDDDSKDKKNDDDDDDDDIPDIGGSTNDDDVPDLGGGSKPEPTPEPTPEPQPEPQGKQMTVEFYQGQYFSMYIPKGWQVYENPYNDGTGVYRIMIGVYDPAKPDNRMIFVTAMEPFFGDQTEYNKMARFLDIDPVVLSSLDAEGVIRGWNQNNQNMRLQHFDRFADIYGTIEIQEITEKAINEDATDSLIPSEVVAKVTGSDGDTYDMYYACALSRLYYAHLGATYYVSYVNYAAFYEDEGESNAVLSGLINACLASLDLTALNQKNNIDDDGEDMYILTPSDKLLNK